MPVAEASSSLKLRLWPTLLAVGCLGLIATAWVTSEIGRSAEDRLQQRFLLDARERAQLIVNAFEGQSQQIRTLQRLVQSVGEADGALFKKIAEPMIRQDGMRDFGWAQGVAAAERDRFEQQLRTQGNTAFAITETDAAGRSIPASARDHYYPLLYRLSDRGGQPGIGLDFFAAPEHRERIERAIERNRPVSVAFDAAPDAAAAPGRAMFFVTPVYRGDAAPPSFGARRASVRGLLFAAFDSAALFESLNHAAPESALNVSLLDYLDPALRIHHWAPEGSAAVDTSSPETLAYQQNFELVDRRLLVRIEAGPEWRRLNATGHPVYIPLIGVLLTLLLLVYLYHLLGRSARADSLEVVHAHDLEQQRTTENWVNKLSMVVEQNPATIVITDLAGQIEYVNEKFVETTGYSRAEAIARHVDILNPCDVEDVLFTDLLATISAGNNWRGELQTRRRDGSVYWERVLIAPIRNASGSITHYVSIKEDISELRDVMHRLQESESRFRAAMSVMVEGLVIVSPNDEFLFGNRAAEEFLGLGESGLQGRTPADIPFERIYENGTICPPENYPSTLALREGRELRDSVLGYRTADGRVRWMAVNASPLRIGDDPCCGTVMTFSDITARRQTEEQLKLAYEAIRNSGEGILVADAEQRILSANPAFEAVTGYRADEVVGQLPTFVSPIERDGHDLDSSAAIREALEKSGYWQGEVWNRRRNGEAYPGWLGVSVVRDTDGRPKYYVYIFSDMTERKEAQKRIEFLAHHDPLTGLPNRLLLSDRVAQAQAQANRMQSRVALMFLDLDRFKTINDSLGHPVGDALLKDVVDRLKSCVRESDTISRQGGDEFVILLNDVRDGEAISRIADKIHQRMADPFVLGAHTLNSSFSIGIAIYPDDGDDFDSLLQKADTAMYHAKEAGRNSHRFFTEQMNLQVVEHLSLETSLRRALENKEFVLHYQPQLDLNEGRVIGVEALIRWNSPENGLVSPGRFIPVAEDSGLIVPIGAWVLGEACRQARAWQDAGLPPFVVAVNLSATQFKRPELVNTVINALVLSDLDSQWLELELTESILIQDAEATLDTVRRLKSLGIKLSVDDFGTGYSSLAYLKRFAVDKLKIDQSFVRDLVADPDDAAIVRAIIQMAHSLKLKTIAEGVESEDLANLLRIFHCDEIQGYWFAKPMPAAELESFLRVRLLP